MLARPVCPCEHSDMPKKRFRLKSLFVDEVSFVDKPAIEREFLVVKARDNDPSEGEHDMSDVKKSVAQRAIDALKSLAGGGDDADGADEAAKAEAKKAADEKAAAEKKSETKKTDEGDDKTVVTDTGETEAVAKAAAETRAAVTAEFEGRLTEMQKSVDEMAIGNATATFRAKCIEKKWPGDAEANAELCVKMSTQLDTDTFKTWFEGNSASAALLEESKAIGGGLFDAVGKSTTGETVGTAVAKAVKAVADVEIKDGDNVFTARKKAMSGVEYLAAQNATEDAKPARK